ncbi:MAG: hypothetical protein JW973_09195 [Bacteroidales bacterium]|nr:hypothetical protein [Bacteroidales bacterium]
MKTNRLISIGKVVAVAILILGIIHDVATYMPLIRGGLSCLSPGTLKAMTYMSLICGTFFIVNGILILVMIRIVESYVILTIPILIISTFLLVAGVLSVVYMYHNPFAWVAFILNTSVFIIALVLRQKVIKK